MIELEIVKVYRIRKKNRTVKYRRSLKGAMGVVAWSMIWEKYDWMEPGIAPLVGGYEPIKPSRYECDCWEGDAESYGWDGCHLHDRHHGYYKRLKNRLTNYLVLRYREELPANFREGVQ